MIPELIDMIFGYIQEPQTDRLVLLTNDYFSSLFDYRNKHECVKKDGNTLFLTNKAVSFNYINSNNVVNFFISKGSKSWNKGVVNSAEHGCKKLVQFFISKGANNWNGGMIGAADAGHLPLVKLFIRKGADDYSWGMAHAAEGGHLDLVKFFISKGADNWNYGMDSAELGGHSSLVEFFKQQIEDS